MTAASLARSAPSFRPRPRWREFGLLAAVGVTLFVGNMGLSATRRAAAIDAAAPPGELPEIALSPELFAPLDPWLFGTYLAGLFVAHLALVLSGRRLDQVLLPAVGLLGGLSLLLMERLPQNLGGALGGLAPTQLVWLLFSLAAVVAVAVTVRSDSWLRRYKYTLAAVGIGLLLLTFVFGVETNGARLTLRIGPVGGQPSELLKVILVVFLAGYLSENRALLVEQRRRIGPISLPPVPYLVPIVAMVAIALAVVVVQRDLGAALLFFAIFLVLLYVATGRASDVVLGLVLFVVGAWIMAQLFGHVRTRIDIWLDPFADPLGAGYQVVQSLHAFARGGLLGTGLGAGLPLVGGRLPIPEIHTDFPFAALGEELGLVGIMAVLGVYLVVIERGLRIAAASADDFRAILAAGLALVVSIQAFIIAAGNLKLVPLTGIALPFISYGGSSLLVNGLVVGLLLALSDRGPELKPPPPGRAGRGPIGRPRRPAEVAT